MLQRWLNILVLLWWLILVVHSLLNRKQFTDPRWIANWSALQSIELTTFQFLVGAVSAVLWLKLVLKRQLLPTNVDSKYVIIMVVVNLVASLAMNAAFSLGAWNTHDLFISWQPVIMFVLLVISGYSKIYQLQSVVLLDLLIMAGGLSMVFSCKMELTVRAVLVAVISTIAWPLRNLFLKRFGESWRDPLQKFGVMSIYGFLFLLPFVLVKFAYSKTIPLIKPEVLFWRSTIQAVGDFLSIMVLESVSPLLHSVLVIIMEFSSVVVGVLYFHLPLCWTMLMSSDEAPKPRLGPEPCLKICIQFFLC